MYARFPRSLALRSAFALIVTGIAPMADAVAGPCLSVCREGRTYVFRGDSRPPSDVFRNGFSPRGSNMDLNRHVSGGWQDSGYVSTTSSSQRASVYAVRAASQSGGPGSRPAPGQTVEGYVYEIEIPAAQVDDTDTWVNIAERFPRDPAARSNLEFAHRGAIPPNLVRRAFPVTQVAGELSISVGSRSFVNESWDANAPISVSVPTPQGRYVCMSMSQSANAPNMRTSEEGDYPR